MNIPLIIGDPDARFHLLLLNPSFTTSQLNLTIRASNTNTNAVHNLTDHHLLSMISSVSHTPLVEHQLSDLRQVAQPHILSRACREGGNDDKTNP